MNDSKTAKKLHPEIEHTKAICDSMKDESALDDFTKQEAASSESQPGVEQHMHPRPISFYEDYQPSYKLEGKVVLITGGDSGIGRAIAYYCSAEGAKIAFSYYNEHDDADETYHYIKDKGAEIIEPMSADLSHYDACKKVVENCRKKYHSIDILINNIAIQYLEEDVQHISATQLQRVFSTNFFSYVYMSQLALPYLSEVNSIINSATVTAYRGSSHLIDYASSKGAIIAFTKSLAKNLLHDKIRVNAVAPGPVWTPLITSSFPEEKIRNFGSDTLYNQPAQPADIAPCYVFLASADSAFMTGQVLHPNGGEVLGN